MDTTGPRCQYLGTTLTDAEPRKREPFDGDPDDYKKPDVPLRGPCDRCNSGMLEYIERLTPGRMARKNEPSRRICKKCFKAAKNRKAKSFRVFPGSL